MNHYPIILSHGIARLDQLSYSIFQRLNLFLWDRSNRFDRLHYFRGIASYLEAHGFTVYKTGVRFAAGVEERARDLRQEVTRILDHSSAERVHIIGHSMGGLDARQMIVDEGMASFVASLTTIGTPHLGTGFADWGQEQGAAETIQALSQFVDLAGFLTLTTAARQAFNERARHSEASNDVFYQTYASVEKREHVFAPLHFSWDIIAEREVEMKENDGLVPLRSQQWTSELVGKAGATKQIIQHTFPMPADHLNQIGWWDLNELNRPGWWKLNLLKEKRRFETAVRQVYLKIAQDVTSLAPQP